jgi:hypothetical protein
MQYALNIAANIHIRFHTFGTTLFVKLAKTRPMLQVLPLSDERQKGVEENKGIKRRENRGL